MNDETLSVIVWYWRDPQTDAMRIRTVRVDTNEEVHFSDGSFLLRISTADDPSVLRCLIRHNASGREAYIQGGANLRAFIKSCLLANDQAAPESASFAPGTLQEEAPESKDALSRSEPQSPDLDEPEEKPLS